MKTTFKGNDVVTSIRIIAPPDPDFIASMMDFSFGMAVCVKCRMGFSRKDSSVSLTAERVDEIKSVKLVVNDK